MEYYLMNTDVETNQRDIKPKRKTPPIIPMSIAIGISSSEELVIIDIMDSQSLEPNVAFFSFALTKTRAAQIRDAMNHFLKEEEE